MKRGPALHPRRSPLPALSALERGLVAAGLVLWALALPVLFGLYRSLEPSPDQSIFDYIAWLAGQGLRPYAASFEVNWPGAILLHMAAQALFGPVEHAARCFDFLVMQLAAIAAAAMLWRNGLRVAAAMFLALYPALYVTAGLWMAGQRDIVAAEVLLVACLCIAGPRRSVVALVIGGALCAAAFAIRPTYLAFLAGVLALELLWPADRAEPLPARLRAMAAIALGAAIVVAGLVVAGLATGTLGPWYEAAVRYAIGCYGSQSPPQSMIGTPVQLLTRSWSWVTALAGVGALAWVLRRDLARYPLVLCLGLAATCVVSYVAQHKGFGYHLGGLLAGFALFTAVAVDSIAHFAALPRSASAPLPRRAAGVALAAVVALCLAGALVKLRNNVHRAPGEGIGWTMQTPGEDSTCEGTPVARSAAAFIARSTAPSARILPVNCGYRAAYLARRTPASRFATSTSFGGSANSCPLQERLLGEYAGDLRRQPPALVLGSAADFDMAAEHPRVNPGGPASAARVAQALSTYRRVARFGDLVIFAPPSPLAAAPGVPAAGPTGGP